MTKRRLFSGLSVCVLILSLALVSCDTGSSSSDEGIIFELTAIDAGMQTAGSSYIMFALFPSGTLEANAKADAIAAFPSGATSYAVAGVSDYPSNLIYSGALSGIDGSGNRTLKGWLYDSNTGAEHWRGSGTFDCYFALRNGSGTWTGYKLLNQTLTGSEGTVSKAASAYTSFVW
jgi:hypothetical protein